MIYTKSNLRMTFFTLLYSGSCSEKSSLTWGLQNGQLTFGNGKMCVVRALDNTAELISCAIDFEHIGLEVPTLHS